MKKLLLFVVLSAALSQAQMTSTGSITTSGTTCGTTNACIVLNLFNTPNASTGSATIVVSGTFSGTIQFEASSDGVNFAAILGQPTAGGASVSSTTGTGLWLVNIPALVILRARASAFASGSATVTIQSSTATAVFQANTVPFPASAASATLAGPYEFFTCSTTCTITPPTPVAGYQFCVRNDDNVATVITLAALTGIQYENTARTSYKTANTTLASAGTVTDQICIVGKDSTHYQVWSFTGTWN